MSPTGIVSRSGRPSDSALLLAEVGGRRPLVARGVPVQGEAEAVLAVYQVLDRHLSVHGDAGLGGLIVSMTRGVEDLLAVHVLAREAGLERQDESGPYLPLPVVPLFETIDDLEAAPDILAAYLDTEVAVRSLARMQGRRERPVQEVMVGYSDSSKDGVVVASFIALYRCQRALDRLAEARGVDVRFFHGRGGTIGRGAGPTHRFLAALPRPRGQLRVTEQGETIAQKYANRVTAAHHLELLLGGTLRATLDGPKKDPPELEAAFDRLATDSRRAYRALVDAPGFSGFFEQATPIDALEHSRIGSRPSRRTGQRTLSDLRAIPLGLRVEPSPVRAAGLVRLRGRSTRSKPRILGSGRGSCAPKRSRRAPRPGTTSSATSPPPGPPRTPRSWPDTPSWSRTRAFGRRVFSRSSTSTGGRGRGSPPSTGPRCPRLGPRCSGGSTAGTRRSLPSTTGRSSCSLAGGGAQAAKPPPCSSRSCSR